MNKTMTGDPANNPFKKLLDDAGRSLADTVSLDFLDELPPSREDAVASIPFPYGAQPENKHGWK